MAEGLLSKICLTASQLRAIQETFASIFLPNDHLWLFGCGAINMSQEDTRSIIKIAQIHEKRLLQALI